jgi:hypothetical protein
MSKTQRKIQFARERNVWVFRLPRDLWKTSKESWGVYVETEWEPRGPMTRRAAKNLAYAISISKKHKLEVKFG